MACPCHPSSPPRICGGPSTYSACEDFSSSDPLDTLNQTRVFAVENDVTLTDEELIALYHLGRLTPEGVREFAAERQALLRAFRHRYRHKDRPQAPPILPLGPATTDRPRAAAAAAGAGGRPTSAGPAGSPRLAASPKSPTLKGAPKRGS